MAEITDYSQYDPRDPGTITKVPPVESKPDIATQRIDLERQKAETIDKPLIENLRSMQSQYTALANRRTPVPPDPKFTEPPLPPAQNFTDPIKAFQNPGVFIATLGSLFSRAPMTAALNAGGAAMEAYHKGQAEVFAQQRELWKENLTVALEKNRIALDKYNVAWHKANAATQDKLRAMQGIAASEQMEVMIAGIRGADFKVIDGILEGLQKAQDQAHLAVVRGEEMDRVARTRAGSIEGVDPIVKAIEAGEQPPVLTGMYRQTANVRAGLARDGFDLSKAQIEWDRAKKQIQSLNGPQMTRFFGLARSVDNTIDEVKSLADEMKLSGIQAVNSIELTALMQTAGNTKEGQLATRYVTAVNTLKEEFANLAQGGYAPTESVWHLANRQINENYGVDQLTASLKEVQRLIRYRLQGFPNIGTLGPNAPNRYTPGAAPAEGGEWQEMSPGVRFREIK